MPKNPLRNTAAFAALLAGLVAAAPLSAQLRPIDTLARDIDRAESVRAVKDLQRTYSQYAQYGLWREMADLFATNGSFTIDKDTVTGRAAIGAYFTKTFGEGHQGLPPQGVRTELTEEPLVNLSADGRTAKARWTNFFLLQDGKGQARFQGGYSENDYVREGGRWRIAAIHFQPLFSGDYEPGWRNWGGGDLAFFPEHFTRDTAGVPIPPAEGAAPKTSATLASLATRVTAMNDADAVRNLQNAYGYYVDRKMWEDVADLFAADAVIKVEGVGLYRGRAGVLRAMERMGSAGLTHGQVNDRIQFDTVVTVTPGGREAHSRGIELGVLGEADQHKAWWEVSAFANRFVKDKGLWKIREMRIFPSFKADYSKGWGKSRIVDPVPTGKLAPDQPASAAEIAGATKSFPAFVAVHPVTGAKIAPLAGTTLVAVTPLTGAISKSPTPALAIAEVQRRLAVSKAYDGAENVSSAYGYYMDDHHWDDLGAVFGKRGAKQAPFAGFYMSAARIAKYGTDQYGVVPKMRPSMSFHWLIQPVILVSKDGRSASMRTHLFMPRTSKFDPTPDNYFAGLHMGMYQNQAILEDGVWRMWNLALDEPYLASSGWKDGWAVGHAAPPEAPPPNRILTIFPPDIPISILGEREEHFIGGVGEPIQWPAIMPMWFPYRNLVSGRVPERYVDDCAPCSHAPDLSMAKHGYLLPPTGPVPDKGQ